MYDSLFNFDWFDRSWFMPNTLKNFYWENAWVWYIIPFVFLIPILKWMFHAPFRQKLEVGLVIKVDKWNFVLSSMRYIPKIIFLLFIICILIAIARPQALETNVRHIRQGMDMVLVLDVSESMLLEDIKPNRLKASQKLIGDFVANRQNDNIGIVIFTSEAFTLLPLTNDLELVKQKIENINYSQLDSGASAIGNALGIAISNLKNSTAQSKLILLLSDGDNTAGNISPETAAALASNFGIKIFSIAIGKNGEAPYGKDKQGNTKWVSSELNEKLLKQISSQTKGLYFKASDRASLKNCFYQINQLSKQSATQLKTTYATDFYQYYLYWSLVFFFIWIALKSSFMNNFMED